MPTLDNIEQIMALYWEGDRSEVRKRYEELFGNLDAPSESNPEPTEEEETDEKVEQLAEKAASVPTDIEAAFSDIVSELGFTEPIEQKLREAWALLPEYDRAIALHHLNLAYDPQGWSMAYFSEGMLNFFGVWTATYTLHCLYPGTIFPIGTDQRYEQLRAILRTFGIDYKDDEELLPIDVVWNLSEAIEEYREQHQLAPWQMWALVYDLGPRLLPQPGPYPTDPPPRVWITAAGPENFAQVDKHTSNDRDTWSINAKARRGDFALMYCLAPRSAIVGVYRCGCDAYRDPLNKSWGGVWAEITDKLPIPSLTFKDIKADPVLGKWQMAKTSFTGLLRHQVPDEIWQRIKVVVAAKDAETGRLLEEFTQSAEGVRALHGPGGTVSEKEFEENLVIPLLGSLGWDLIRNMRRQYEMDIKVGSGRPHRVRADFVGFREALSSEALLVIESKRRIRSDEELRLAIEQCESYAGKLRCTRFVVAAPEGLWIYTLNFPGQSQRIAHFPLQADLTPQMVEQLKPLIGFNTLLV